MPVESGPRDSEGSSVGSLAKNPSSLPELTEFAQATPELLQERGLQRRVDTKFILPLDNLRSVLADVRKDYGLLTADGAAEALYKTLYFDTANYRCLREHHRGQRPRHKIRIRHYLDRKLTFLEIKKKTNAGRTVKTRQSIEFLRESLGSSDRDFIDMHSPIPADTLRQSLRTDFHRVTLLGLETMERVTFDVDLCLAGSDFPGAVIAEIKQERFSARSPVMLALRRARVLPVSVSKYCTAGALHLRSLRMNRYLPRVRSLRRVCRD